MLQGEPCNGPIQKKPPRACLVCGELFEHKRGKKLCTKVSCRTEWTRRWHVEHPVERKTLIQQFNEKVKWGTAPHGCLEATGYDNGDGYKYGSFFVDGKTRRITLHRLSYMLHIGDIPPGMCVMHSCDNRACINPEHLRVGTRKQNTQDMMAKGRCARRAGKERGKLSTEEVNQIRESKLSSYRLAEIYPVSAVQIRRIKAGTRCRDM